MNRVGKITAVLAGGLVTVAGVGWLGLQVPPKNFPPPAGTTPEMETVAIPPDLPASVHRYFTTVLGNEAPIIDSAIVWGRPRIRINGLWMPLRFRSAFNAGRDYHRTMEVTWFGLPIIEGVESYVDGEGYGNIAGGVSTGPKMDQASNIALWAEAVWMPSVYLTDPRVRWEAIDDTSARLVVPFGDDEDSLLFTFDPDTGLVTTVEAMRYRDADAPQKTRWWIEALAWQEFHGMVIPTTATLTWEDEGTPWAYWEVEGVEYNVDVSETLPAETVQR